MIRPPYWMTHCQRCAGRAQEALPGLFVTFHLPPTDQSWEIPGFAGAGFFSNPHASDQSFDHQIETVYVIH
eukprot:jgi/Botrbrau1/20407/Bobra.0006s0064.1